MTDGRFRDNPYFIQHVKQLRKLHELIAQGKDDEQGDVLRDEMDVSWGHLYSEEIGVIKGLSADLYTIGETRCAHGDVPVAVIHEFKDVTERGDWQGVLRLIRHHGDTVPPAEAAGLRGMAWARLGLFDIAIPFFEEALRLAPGERMYELVYLTGLIEAEQTGLAVEKSDEIVQTTSDPARLLKAAEVYFVWASTLTDEAAARNAHQRAVELAERGLKHAQASPDDPLVEQLAFYTHLHLSLSWKQLGELNRAVEACRAALVIDPENLDALLLMENLTAAPEPGFSEDGFCGRAHRAIAVKSTDNRLLDLASSTMR